MNDIGKMDLDRMLGGLSAHNAMLEVALELAQEELKTLRAQLATLREIVRPLVEALPELGPGGWYWEQSYELRHMHWALHDSESEKTGRIASLALILWDHSPENIFGKPMTEDPYLRFIVTARAVADALAGMEAGGEQ